MIEITHQPGKWRTRLDRQREAQILTLTHETAVGSREIAKRIGVSHMTVHRVWARHQINRKEIIEQNALAVAHRDLARNIARNIAKDVPSCLESDLIGIAMIGLVQAARRYKSDVQGAGYAQPVSFGAYAGQRIRGACLDSIRRRHWKNATADELTPQAAEARADTTAVSAEDSVIDLQARTADRVMLTRAILSLPGRLAVVTWMHHFQRRTIEQIAVELGVGASRVSQLHTEALGLMRTQLKAKAAGVGR